MTQTDLLNDKLMPAALPDICAPRHRLLNIFDRNADKRVIFVSAPAGYGKTVSALLWLSHIGRNVIWLSLDRYDSAPSIFYKLFCTGILSAQPENTAMADILKSPSFASSPVEHTIRLLSEFIPDGNRYALVLDDMHLVTDKEIRKSGLFVQKRIPLSFITLILTRNRIAEEYISTVGEERTAVITDKELAFSTAEIQDYFDSLERPLTAAEAKTVRDVTDGWPMGVNAVAKSGRIEPRQPGGKLLEHYIERQVWDNWDEDLRDFMLKTAPVDEMPVELCKRLTGREDSRDILERLCGGNAFVSRLSGDIYRYHHLFSEFLRDRMTESGIDAGALYKEAAKYYIDRGEYFMARRYASKGGDTDALMRVAHQFSQYRSACVDEFVNFSKMYASEAPPGSVCDEAPFLYAIQMWEHYLLGDAAKMEYYMDKVYEFLPVIIKKFPQYAEPLMMEISLDHRIPLSKQIEMFALLPPIEYWNEGQQGATLTHEMPLLHRSNRDYHELADDALREKLGATFGQLLRDSIGIFLSGIHSGLLLEKNLLKEAMDAALRTRNLVNEHTSYELRFSVLIHLAEVYCAVGDAKWDEVMAETESFINEKDARYLLPNLMAYKTKILLWDGNKSAARSWLENYFVIETERLPLYKIFQHFTTARAYIALGQTDKAMNYILKLKNLGSDFRRLLDSAEARVLQAIVEWATGSRKESQLTMETVLNDMQPHGFIRVIADEGAAVLPILKKLLSGVEKPDYQGALDRKYLNDVYLAAYTQSKRRKSIAADMNVKPVRLSRQQRLMVELLSRGYKNMEIAGETGLTINTIKTHTRITYDKLGVTNAADAILKARELGIIE